MRRAFERAWWMSPLLLLPSGCPSRAVIGSDGGATEGDATTMTATGEPADSGAENTLPVAGNDAYLAMMDSAPLAIAANAGVLVNDVDADGDALEVVPQLGVVTAGGAGLALQADGSFTYAPAASWWGQDTFEYTVVDDRG
ncbi:MAG: cadherin-like domain-containing protein, partial [Myxococcales bacterium]|nr:cadherin-like domain-containing protein [Myxococcales bacterium]